MADQTKVSGNGKAADPNVAASVSSFAHDAIELAELQAQLLKLDAQIAARNGRNSLALTVFGICLLLGCVPVALLALAEVFVAEFEWTRAGSLAAAAAIGLAICAVAFAAAWQRVQAALASLQRSRDELNRNIAWMKSSLKRGKSRPFSASVDRPT